MAVTFTIQLPKSVEDRVRASVADLDATAEEALLVALYRRGTLTHRALSELLRLDRFQTESVLRRHNVVEDLGTPDDYLSEALSVEGLLQAKPR